MRQWAGWAGALTGFGLSLAAYAWLGTGAVAAVLAGAAAWSVARWVLFGSLRAGRARLYLGLFAAVWVVGAVEDLPRFLKPSLILLFAIAAGTLVVRAVRSPSERRSVSALAAALCSLLVALLSGGQGAPGAYPSWLELLFGIDEATAGIVSTLSRKVAHFLFYGTFALSVFRAAVPLGEWRASLVALKIVGLHAGADELRQVSHVARSGSVGDVLLDLAGAVVLLAVASRLRRRRLV